MTRCGLVSLADSLPQYPKLEAEEAVARPALQVGARAQGFVELRSLENASSVFGLVRSVDQAIAVFLSKKLFDLSIDSQPSMGRGD
jgi:hypothetical protein